MSQPSTTSSNPQEQAGAGSVWNPGNWHWESKNFNKVAEESVRSRLLSIVVDDNRFVVRIIDIPKLKAEASINIRKGKKVPMFDISFTAKWEGKSILGADKIITGEAIVSDLMPDDIDEDFPIRLQLSSGQTNVSISFTTSSSSTSTTPGNIDACIKILVTTLLVQQIRFHMREFVKQISNLDGGPEILIADTLRRAEERLKYEEALISKAAEKDRIAKEQSKLEKQRKDNELAKFNKAKQEEQEKQQKQEGKDKEVDSPVSSITSSTSHSTSSSATIIPTTTTNTSSISSPSPLTSTAESGPLKSTTTDTPKASVKSSSSSSSSSSSFGNNLRNSFFAASNPKPITKPIDTPQAVEHTVNLEGKAVPAGEAPDAKASEWNTGGWQWEEKDFTPWSKTRLIELLVGIDIDIPGGHVKVVEVTEVKGEATIALRKGKKIVIFELNINAKWEGGLMDGDGNSAGNGDGEIVITELDQDCESYQTIPLIIKPCDDGGANDKQLSKLLNKWGIVAIKKKIWQFVEELKAKE